LLCRRASGLARERGAQCDEDRDEPEEDAEHIEPPPAERADVIHHGHPGSDAGDGRGSAAGAA